MILEKAGDHMPPRNALRGRSVPQALGSDAAQSRSRAT